MKTNVYKAFFIGVLNVMLPIYAQQGMQISVPKTKEQLRIESQKQQQSYIYRDQSEQKHEESQPFIRSKVNNENLPKTEGKHLKSSPGTKAQMLATHPEE